MALKIWLDGEFVNKEDARISVFDHGLLYGDGVFEGIRSYNRRVFRLGEHVERLYEGAADIKLTIPMEESELRERILETLRENGLNDAYVRVVVTRGVGDLGLDPRKCPRPTVFIIADTIALYPEAFYRDGLSLIIAATRRNNPMSLDPRIKSLNYLNNILGKIEAINAGVPEAIMLSIHGRVAECTGDNILIVKDGRILTPPSETGALRGITQRAVIELAERDGIITEFKEMYPEELYDADECFLTGTAAEIIPVVRIGDRMIGDGKPGRMTGDLMKGYRRLTTTEGAQY
jgi:branched-chain amino acid aminotransferase